MRMCSVADCSRPHFAKGFCNPHHLRNKRYGDPLTQRRASPGAWRAWLDQMLISGSSVECWLWPFGTRNGYACARIDGHCQKVHRYVIEVVTGHPIPKDLLACHRCDVPICVNPHHIFVGTHLDNIYDMMAKGRAWFQNGTPLPVRERDSKTGRFLPGKPV